MAPKINDKTKAIVFRFPLLSKQNRLISIFLTPFPQNYVLRSFLTIHISIVSNVRPKSKQYSIYRQNRFCCRMNHSLTNIMQIELFPVESTNTIKRCSLTVNPHSFMCSYCILPNRSLVWFYLFRFGKYQFPPIITSFFTILIICVLYQVSFFIPCPNEYVGSVNFLKP